MITRIPFGTTKNGEKVNAYIMQSGKLSAAVLEYGAAIQKLTVETGNGDAVDVIMGYDDLASYETGTASHGSVVGRYANRIKNAAFCIDGREYKLIPNEGKNHKHGVFDKKVFTGEIQGDTLVLRRLCPAYEEGYPGN